MIWKVVQYIMKRKKQTALSTSVNCVSLYLDTQFSVAFKHVNIATMFKMNTQSQTHKGAQPNTSTGLLTHKLLEGRHTSMQTQQACRHTLACRHTGAQTLERKYTDAQAQTGAQTHCCTDTANKHFDNWQHQYSCFQCILLWYHVTLYIIYLPMYISISFIFHACSSGT